jgi:predicted TIM-barrel fold metal-dependent hydrolase
MGEMFKNSNLWACELNKKHPQIVPFIGVDPWVLSSNEMEAHLRDMAKRHNARGVKVHPVVQRFYMHDARMMPIWSACEELGLPIMAHSGPAQGGEQYAEPRAYKNVLEAFPQLKIVLAHMGGASWRQLPEVSSYQNAYYDICEIIEWTGASNGPTKTELARLIKKVGPERVMMGSDFPWYDIDHTIEVLMSLPLLSKEEKEAILGANAVRILDI